MSLLNPPSRFAAAHTHGPDQNKWQKLLRHALRPELLQTLVDSPSAISRVQPSTTRRVVHAEHVMYEERTLIVLGGSEATHTNHACGDAVYGNKFPDTSKNIEFAIVLEISPATFG